MEKTIDIGGTSDISDAAAFVEFAKTLNPRTVLDIGTGCYGKAAYLLRQYVEHKFRKYYGTNYMQIFGIEAYTPNYEFLKANYPFLYTEVFNEEAIPFYRNHVCKGEWILAFRTDVIIISHVLEHHTEEDAWELLRVVTKSASKGVIVACPNGNYEHHDANNPYQNHRSVWTPDKIASMYPITSPVMSLNNEGVEQFTLVIPSQR